MNCKKSFPRFLAQGVIPCLMLMALLGLPLPAFADECPVLSTFDSQLSALAISQSLTIDTADLNSNSILDKYEFNLLSWALCSGRYYLEDEVMAAYEANLAATSATWLDTYSMA